MCFYYYYHFVSAVVYFFFSRSCCFAVSFIFRIDAIPIGIGVCNEIGSQINVIQLVRLTIT